MINNNKTIATAVLAVIMTVTALALASPQSSWDGALLTDSGYDSSAATTAAIPNMPDVWSAFDAVSDVMSFEWLIPSAFAEITSILIDGQAPVNNNVNIAITKGIKTTLPVVVVSNNINTIFTYIWVWTVGDLPNNFKVLNDSDVEFTIPLASETSDFSLSLTINGDDGSYADLYVFLTVRDDDNADNADLVNLTISHGTLSPTFSDSVTAYTASVGNSVSQVILTPTASHDSATIAVNDEAVDSAAGYTVTDLTEGDNTITVIVTAQDTMTTKTYTVTVTRAAPSLSSDANLDNLTINPGMLSPTFSDSVTAYTASVGNSVSQVILTPTASHDSATIAVNDEAVDSAAGYTVTDLTEGDNTITVIVTAQDAMTTKTYTVTVTRAAPSLSSDANLDNLTINPGMLSPTFSDSVTAYTASVGNSVSQVILTPTASHDSATIAVNDEAVDSAAGYTVTDLTEGDNTITVIVTAQDTMTTKTYTVTVTRAAPSLSSDANLDNLTINPGMLSPTFSDSVTAYTASVGNSVSQVILTPTASHDSATIAVNDEAVDSAAGYTVTDLTEGDNTITVIVTAQDAMTTKTYTVTVTRAAPSLSSDANLDNLTINPGMLSPTFSDSVTAYTASVGNSVSQVILTPTASHDSATIAVNDEAVDSAAGYTVTDLTEGDNTITVIVTAQDAMTTKTYTVTVTRAAPSLSSDANLDNLTINPGMLSPTFSDSVTAYTASVGNSVSQVILTPTASHDSATIAVNDEAVDSAAGYTVTDLTEGDNTITVIVTAQDAMTTKTYTVTVTRAAPSLSSDANLDNLTINPGMLSPTFSDSVTAYTASVGNSVSQVILTPTASHDSATIAVNDEAVDSAAGYTVTDLTEGDNTITVIVTAQDTTMTKTYIITVTVRDAENVPPQPIRDASQKRSSSSSIAPIVDLDTLTNARIVDIPPHIAEQVASHDDSDPLELLMLDDTFDFPLVINNYGYLLDDVTNTLVPQIVTVGDDDPTVITFTVYTQKDLAYFILYLNLQDDDTSYADSDTYITYTNDGTVTVTDPNEYIADATITVTQEDNSMPEKKTVTITIEFGEEPMGLTNMVAYMWNTDRKSTIINLIDAIDVTAAAETRQNGASTAGSSTSETVNPEPDVSDDDRSDGEGSQSSINSGIVVIGGDAYDDDVQTLSLIRMWSGFASESITDAELLESMGLDNYPVVHIPDWVMTELGALVSNNDVTVKEFRTALVYMLEMLTA